LTRRGRLALVLTVMALMVTAGVVWGQGSSRADSGARVAPRTVTVAPGDSLWSVAHRLAPQQDPRLVIAKIESLNDLPSAAVVAGQQLVVPTFS
jgi:hypothetical protein